MGKHEWREEDFFTNGTARADVEEPPAGGGGSRPLFYIALALFALLLAAGACWVAAAKYGLTRPVSRPVTLLLVGVDHRAGDNGRTDSMILLNYNPEAQRLYAVSLPRDTRVLVPGYSTPQKVNAAYALGGIDLTRQTVAQLFGLKVDYYVAVDFKGFADAVDALGGVQLAVPKTMDYDDNAQNLHIHLRPGQQRLTGEQALGFVRYRSDGLGDVSLVDTQNQVYDGRVTRQQMFLRALVAQALNPVNLWRLPGLIQTIARSVTTDMPLSTMLNYAQVMRKLPPGALTTALLPGDGEEIAGASYWIPNAEGLAALESAMRRADATLPKSRRPATLAEGLGVGLHRAVAALAPARRVPGGSPGIDSTAVQPGPKTRPAPRIVVLNGTGVPGVAKQAAAALAARGFTVVATGNAERFGYRRTTLYAWTGRTDAEAKVRELVPGLDMKTAGQVDGRGQADFTLIVGEDLRL